VLLAQSTSTLSSRFLFSQGNAEVIDKGGGKTKHRLISYFISNTSAKNYCNRIVYVKTIASQRWDDFLRHSVTVTDYLLKVTYTTLWILEERRNLPATRSLLECTKDCH